MKRNHILTAVVVSAAAFLAVGCDGGASQADLAALEAKVDLHRAKSQAWANLINTRQQALAVCVAEPPNCVPIEPGTQPPATSGW